MSQEDIIPKEKGVQKVQSEGIGPFLAFIESSEREFFKAKDFVTLYDLIFKMCIQRDPYNWSETMYELYTHSILDYLLSKVQPAFVAARSQYDVAFLKEWKTRWANQKLIVQGLAKLFMYLDRFYTPNTDGILTLKEQGYKNYKEQVFDTFAPVARQAILNAIEKERNNEEQDGQLLKESVLVFVEMGYNYNSKKLSVYTNDLEKYIVDHAGQYYQRQSRVWMDQDSTPIYLEKVEKVLQQETARVTAYLNRATQEPLARELYIQLLKTHQKELLRKKTGLFHLLSINAVDDLSRLYRLYKGNESDLEPIAEMFEEFITREGTAVVDAAKAAQSAAPKEGEEKKEEGGAAAAPAADANHALVRNLIGLHAQYNEIVNRCFEKTQIMQKSLKKAFEEFINKDNRVSKLLAKFVHEVLRKGSKVNVRDIESTLDNVVFLYGYISEKDVFERDYQCHLSNRLLMGLCESEHSERSMIAKLKTECGYQWTNKLEGMFKDVQLSKDLMANFKKMFDTTSAAASNDVTLEVNVCTTGYWPCLTVDHELLTQRGWRPIRLVQAKVDRVMTINPKTRALEWQQVDESHALLYPPTEKLYRVADERMDAVVTPNHKWLTFATTQGEGAEVEAGRFDVTYETLSWDAKSEERFVPLSAINGQERFVDWNLSFLASTQSPIDEVARDLDWCRFVGFALAHGASEDQPTVSKVISPKSLAGQQYLAGLLQRLDFQSVVQSTEPDVATGLHTYAMTNEEMGDFFLPGIDAWKYLLSQSQARALIDGWVAATAESRVAGDASMVVGYASSVSVRDDLLMIGALANARTSTSAVLEKQVDSLASQWKVEFDYSQVGGMGICATGYSAPVEYRNPSHDGRVYSVSVANANYYARRVPTKKNPSGVPSLRPFFTGNSSRIIPCLMPKELTSACDKYKRFYLNQHSGHKLEWRFDQGQAEITIDFNATTRKALVVSTYQMMVLLVFNSAKRVTYKQMLDMTGIPKAEIANHLLSLCHPKVNILLKRPNSKALADNHQFMINPQYKNALKKVTIPLLRAVENEESSEEENKTIELQRRHQMDASIVRIMKTRKTLRHNLLVAEVISQLSARFKPLPNNIKKRIEALIEQEYMERDVNERGTYNYKA